MCLERRLRQLPGVGRCEGCWGQECPRSARRGRPARTEFVCKDPCCGLNQKCYNPPTFERNPDNNNCPIETAGHLKHGEAHTRMTPMKTVAMALVALAAGLHGMRSARAQVPASIAGVAVEATVISGTWPFANAGSFRLLPSATDNTYGLVVLSGTGRAATGHIATQRRAPRPRWSSCTTRALARKR